LATFSLSNFAVIDGQFILIYDSNGVIRHSIIPHESDFYTRGINCIVETHGNNSQPNNNSAFNADKYLILDFSSESEAAQATEKLFNLKTTIRYYVNWDNIIGTPNTISNYGITDAYTKSETNNIISGITVDLSAYYTSAQTNANFLSANTFDNIINTTEINNIGNISANTFFGDGSNLTGIITTNTFTTGATLSGSTAVFYRNDGYIYTLDLSDIESFTNFGRILFVSVGGNDLNAEVGNLNKPFLTLKAARDAAISGDTIYVFPQTFIFDNRNTTGNQWNGKQVDINLWKDGVTYFFTSGTKIIFYNQTVTGEYLYLFKPLGNIYGNCKVLGYLYYEQNSIGADSFNGNNNFLDGNTIGTDLGYEFYVEMDTVKCNSGEFLDMNRSNNVNKIKITTITKFEYSNYLGGQSNSGAFININDESDGTLEFNSYCYCRISNTPIFYFYLQNVNKNNVYNICGESFKSESTGNIFFMGSVKCVINYNVSNSYYTSSYTRFAAWGAIVSTGKWAYWNSNFTINITGNLIDNSPNTYTTGIFYLNTLNNTINFNGNITTNTSSGIGRFIAVTTSNTYGNNVTINGNIYYIGTGTTTNVMFQPQGANVINYTGKISGNYAGTIAKTYNGTVNINNSYINLLTNYSTLKLIENGGTASGTCKINNSYVELANGSNQIVNGSYVNVLINNSTIINKSSGGTFYNNTQYGSLQTLNSMIYANSGTSINYTNTAPVISFGTVTNTPYTATTFDGSLATLTNIII